MGKKDVSDFSREQVQCVGGKEASKLGNNLLCGRRNTRGGEGEKVDEKE